MSSGLPVSFTIVMVFVFLIIGFFAGRAVSLMVYKRKFAEKEAQFKASYAATGSPPAPVAPVTQVEQPAPLADPAKYTELLRLWKNKENGKMFVETSGHLLATSAPLNPSQKKRFIDLIKDLAIWIGIPPNEVAPAAVEPASRPSSFPSATVPNAVQPPAYKPTMVAAGTPVKTDPLPAPKYGLSPDPVQATPPPPVPISTLGSQPIVPPAPYAVPTPATASKPVSEPVKKQAVSMVEQIDEILQEIIQQSVNPTRRIKLMEERNQGVIVWVDQEHFNGIDAVTDESARELIRAAAKEWERRAESHQ
jgi:hypothetical protein